MPFASTASSPSFFATTKNEPPSFFARERIARPLASDELVASRWCPRCQSYFQSCTSAPSTRAPEPPSKTRTSSEPSRSGATASTQREMIRFAPKTRFSASVNSGRVEARIV